MPSKLLLPIPWHTARPPQSKRTVADSTTWNCRWKTTGMRNTSRGKLLPRSPANDEEGEERCVGFDKNTSVLYEIKNQIRNKCNRFIQRFFGEHCRCRCCCCCLSLTLLAYKLNRRLLIVALQISPQDMPPITTIKLIKRAFQSRDLTTSFE